ncbi:MAG: GNAT family N-acetyltransferase [Anaerorhabdus sp.]|uniref:GNAT family N-acetyltransferase n=1 Tax=Anaerorhabdus sp. TaxID=1872524 RepID=UPI002B1FBB69|nr:GNAT family N-acetyltransferase [Anaerorhabdus sp.]MEA4875860.1 GNAT family N-acetyltransferase [Anaerorhabdus sp.]
MKNVSIRRIQQESLTQTKFHFIYHTKSYYDVEIKGTSFNLVLKHYEKEITKEYDDILFGEWLEVPELLGIYVNDSWAGFIEGSIEMWNNRYRITNLLVFDEFKGQNLGTRLIREMITLAKSKGVRMIVLEVLSSNANAIQLYQKNGFEIIGFDLYAYSNSDIKNNEFRIDMGMRLEEENG